MLQVCPPPKKKERKKEKKNSQLFEQVCILFYFIMHVCTYQLLFIFIFFSFGSKPGFLSLGALDVWGLIIFVAGTILRIVECLVVPSRVLQNQ